MKSIRNLTLTLLALAGTALLAPQAKAQNVEFQTQSYLGFEDVFLIVSDTAESAPHGYAVDLGSASQFVNLAPGTTLDLGNFNADLTSVFGAVSGGGTWQTSQATWEVAGHEGNNVGPIPYRTTFTTAQTGSLSTYLANTSKWASPAAVNTTIGKTTSGLGTLGTDGNSIILASTATNSNFGFTGDSAEASIGDSDNNSLLSSSLDLMELPTSSSNSNKYAGTAIDLGTFTLDAQGDLMFTAAAPEPTTWAMMLGGLGFLVWTLRRKQAVLA